jgi:hypothetical protein
MRKDFFSKIILNTLTGLGCKVYDLQSATEKQVEHNIRRIAVPVDKKDVALNVLHKQGFLVCSRIQRIEGKPLAIITILQDKRKEILTAALGTVENLVRKNGGKTKEIEANFFLTKIEAYTPVLDCSPNELAEMVEAEHEELRANCSYDSDTGACFTRYHLTLSVKKTITA